MTVLGRHLPTRHHLMFYACVGACVAVVAAIAIGFVPLVAVGAIFCGAMMVGMVWMMFSMMVKRR
jgi:Flp pilus assembly protein TadB